MGDAVNAGNIIVEQGFAWCPATANNRAVIDYTTREGQNLFNGNTACLYSDKTVCFSAQAEGLQGFLNHMIYRTKQADWQELFDVPVDFHLADGVELPFLTNYGQFTLDYLTDYITEEHLLLNDRWQQDNFQCQTCIFKSLSEEALNRINLCEDDFTIANQVQSLLLMKVIIRESRVETPHRTRIIRQNLSSMDVQFKKQGYDVDKLNTYVLGQLADLAAMGESSTDVVANLFKAYLSAPDEEFTRYISNKQSLADEGEEMNSAHLMVLAGNKYKGRIEAGTWNAPNKDQVKLLALAAELEHVKKLIPTAKHRSTTSSNNTKITNDSTKTKKPFTHAEWQTVKPTALEIQNKYTKKVGGKEYKWCAKHAFWCSHSTAECRKPDATSTDQAPKDASDEQKNKIVAAFNAIADSADEE